MNTPRFLTIEKRQAAVAIEHPRKTVVPLAIGLSWRDDGAMYFEKLDGKFAVRELEDGSVLAGEWTRIGFTAWDCLAYQGKDARGLWTLARWDAVNQLCQRFGLPVVKSSPHGGALLQDVLARGGEGVVRKLASASYFDPMEAAKRVQTWRCVVTALDYGTGGAAIAERMEDGRLEDRGTVPLRGRATSCRVGSLVKVEGMELTAAGKIREPRPCKDTETSWLIQF
jgi:ATP-dependent DNA ligase